MEIGIGIAASDLENIKKGSKAMVYIEDIKEEVEGVVKKNKSIIRQ